MKKVSVFLFCIAIISAIVIYAPDNTQKTDATINNHNEPDNEPVINRVLQKHIDVPAICQYPELPTGCESVAATMVLQYYNVNITAEKFAKDWLECSDSFYLSNGKLYGPDPNKVFAGNPFSRNSYGCYAEPIVHAINRNSTSCTAKAITGRTLEQLCAEYIANNKPLLIWATINMKESKAGNSWYFEDGKAFTWIAGEHCLVLVGYNDDYYFLNDPVYGSTVAYQKNITEKRFAELASQAVYICPNKM